MRSRSLIAAAVGLALSVTMPAAASADHRSLAAGWTFDESSGQAVYDHSGHGNHGVLGDTTAAESSDPLRIRGPWYRRNMSLRFDGDDHVSVPDSPTLEPTQFKVAALVRAAGTPGAYRYIVSKGALACQAASYGLYTGPDGGLSFYVSDGSTYSRSPDAGAGVWDGRWHLAVGSYDGETVRLRVDGEEVGSGTPTSVDIGYGLPDSERLYIGNYGGPCATTLGFIGDIDAAGLWNRASDHDD